MVQLVEGLTLSLVPVISVEKWCFGLNRKSINCVLGGTIIPSWRGGGGGGG